MRASFIRKLERKMNNRLSVHVQAFLETRPYAGTSAVAAWLLGIFKKKVQGAKTFPDFDLAIAGQINTILAAGDPFYHKLFRQGKFIDIHTKEHESKTPYTDVVRSIYNRLFAGNNVNDDKLTIYSELRVLIEKELGRQLANDPVLQTYDKWVAINKLLEVQYEVNGEWRSALSVAKVRTEQAKFLLYKKRSLAHVANLLFSFHRRDKAAKDYVAQLRKLSKKSIYEYADAAIKHADEIHFTPEVSFQKALSRRLGIKEFLTFIDHLQFPIAQHHALLLVDELDDYVRIVQEICSRTPLRTPREYLLIYALKNYFDFIKRTLSELEYIRNNKWHSHQKEPVEVTEAKQEAERCFNDWKDNRIRQSFDQIMTAVFPKAQLSVSKYIIPFFNWLNSYSKLHLTHSAASSQRELIDLFNDRFQQRLDTDSRSYHYLSNQLLNGRINQEGLKKLVSVLTANPGDTSFRDKLYRNYLTHLESEHFRWYAEGNVDEIEAINEAFFFSQVLCTYADGDARWLALYYKHRTIHEGWLLTSASDTVGHQREAYLLCAGVGMAHFRYTQSQPEQATTTLFDVIQLLFQQLRKAYDRKSINYETPLWFAGATIVRYAPPEKDRFITLLCTQVDSLKLFLRVVYEFLFNAETNSLSAASSANIQQRIQDEFFIIASSKVDVDLRHDYERYKKMKQFIEENLFI